MSRLSTLLGRNDEADSDETNDQTETEDEEPETESVETVTLVEEETKTFEYTEHTGMAYFADGTSKPFVFDGMKRDDGDIILWDYSGELVEHHHMTHPTTWEPNQRQKFATISSENYKYFITTDREKKEMSKVIEDEYDVERPRAEDLVNTDDPDINYYIKEDQ